ncbi:MAG: glucosamine-6-phosphate deaminase, partial [Chloroflexi bacterium]|nr:glucosamine-6-phosphate deaminase [Chloroflexota bacterium]
MKLIAVNSYEDLSRQAADIMESQIRQKPNSVLGLATGSTPLGCYQELVRRHQASGLDFSEISTFNLDEYYNLPPDNPNSYHYYMNHFFFDHINIDKNATHIPNGMPIDLL